MIMKTMLSDRKFKLFSLFVLISIFFFGVMVVNAEGEDDYKGCADYTNLHVSNYNNTYGVTIDYNDETKEFIIKMVGNEGWFKYDAQYKTRQFYISKIEYVNIDQDTMKDASVRRTFDTPAEISNTFGIPVGTRLSLNKTLTFKNSLNSVTRLKVYFAPDGFSDVELVKNCGSNATFHIMVNYDYFGEAIHHPAPTVVLKEMPKTLGEIDCSQYTLEQLVSSATSFNELYCRDTKIAQSSGVQYTHFGSIGDNATTTYFEAANMSTIKFQCDAFKQLTADAAHTIASTSDANYYENKSYLLGETSFTINAGTYTYNYGGQVHDENGKPTGKSMSDEDVVTEPIQCSVSCKEVVTVEYGPPVASKAGLCFGYKVKVTSRVNCSAKEPNEPRKQGYCTPSPGCNHGHGFKDRAAGPSEDFDACVEQCDGGKYTSKCSVQCYNKVYNSSANALTNSDINDFETLAIQLRYKYTVKRDKAKDCEGYYYRDHNNVSIYGKTNAAIWAPDNVLGRWYCENHWSAHACVKKQAEGGGISSVCGCGATCRWNGCYGEVYLNPDEAELDADKNKEEHDRAIDVCSAYSKCSTNQAEFSIEVDYLHEENGENKSVTIKYPYESAPDTIKYTTKDLVACTNKNSSTTIIGFDGCYNCGASNVDGDDSSSRMYMTEWTFPGVWFDLKSGKISYVPVDGWSKKKGTFCLPANALNVNAKWWNAYYIAQMKRDEATSGITYSYNSNTVEKKACTISSCSEPTSAFTQNDVSNLDYNIRAKARKFGLFGWNIDIECFYALNDDFPYYGNSGQKTCNTDCPSKKSGYSIRSVDLANIFPSTEGETLSGSDTTGRAPGFNWSAYATNTKDSNYSSNPKTYRSWVQELGYNVYSDEYLDYDITLTKSAIAKLRKLNKQTDGFNRSSLETNVDSIAYYRSDLLRGSNAILMNESGVVQHIPSESVLHCNNIKNYASNECFVEEEN